MSLTIIIIIDRIVFLINYNQLNIVFHLSFKKNFFAFNHKQQSDQPHTSHNFNHACKGNMISLTHNAIIY